MPVQRSRNKVHLNAGHLRQGTHKAQPLKNSTCYSAYCERRRHHGDRIQLCSRYYRLCSRLPVIADGLPAVELEPAAQFKRTADLERAADLKRTAHFQ